MKRRRVYVIVRRMRSNRYSIAALIAATDIWYGRAGSEPPPILFADSTGEVVGLISKLLEKGFQPVVLYSMMTTSLVEDLSAIRREIGLARSKGAITILGGPHATGDPLGSLRLGFDYVIIGEGEEVLPPLLASIEEGLDEARIRGIAFLDNDRACYTGRAPQVNLDDYPNFPYWRGIYAPIELTRGCVHACLFCQVSFTQGATPRHRSLEGTLHLAEEFLRAGRRDLRFITPNAFSYLGDGWNVNLEGLCSLVEGLTRLTKRYGGRFFLGSFPSEVRPEHAAIEEAVRCIAGRVANKRVIVGAQSGSNRVLKMMHRGHTVEDVVAAVETLNAYGFIADVDVIIGFPGETREDLEATVKLSELLTTRYKARIHAHYYLPLPGTPLSGMEPERPPRDVLRRLYRLLGRGLLYGDWLKQYKLSWTMVELYEKGVIVGLRGYASMKKCRGAPIRPYPSSPLAS